jgi:chromosomal replication initiation ATPase DnaA
MPQLVLPFGVQPSQGRDAFIVAPCNEQAFRFVEGWPDWPARAVALYGPTGSGKSHLVQIWRARSGGRIANAAAPGDGDDWDRAGAIAVEDVDAPGLDRERRDRALMALFERPSGALLLTGRTPPSEWKVAIGDLRSRFDSLLAFPMWEPDDALLCGLLRKHFADRQLAVSEGVVRRILTHVERSPEAIAAFVARADARALAERRAITERMVLELVEREEGG